MVFALLRRKLKSLGKKTRSAVDGLSGEKNRVRDIVLDKHFVDAIATMPNTLGGFLSRLVERPGGAKVLLSALQSKPVLIKEFAQASAGDPEWLDYLTSNKLFMSRLFENGRLFEQWTSFVQSNPEAFHRMVVRPEAVSALALQNDFLTLLATEEFVEGFIDSLSYKVKRNALQRLFSSEFSFLDEIKKDPVAIPSMLKAFSREKVASIVAGDDQKLALITCIFNFLDEHAESVVDFAIRNNPSLVRSAFEKGPAKDLAMASLAANINTPADFFTLCLHNSQLGGTVGERILILLKSILSAPAMLQALRHDDDLGGAICKTLAEVLKDLGIDIIKEFAPPISAELRRYPGAALAYRDEEGASPLAADDGVVDSVKQLEQYLPAKTAEDGRLAMRYARKGSLEAYLNAVMRSKSLPTTKGRFSLVDVKSAATIIDEILVKEEYYCELGERPFIIDAGANIGLATFYLKSKYPDATVIAIEPVPEFYELAQKNFEACGLSDVDLRQVAISSDGLPATMFLDNSNSLAASLTERRVGKTSKISSIEVETITLGSLIERPVDLLKLDIEGSEFEAITGLGEKLTKVHYLFCEFHADDQTARAKLAEMLAHLVKYNFSYQIARTSWAEKRFGFRPLQYAHRSVSYGIYAVNLGWNAEGDRT